ncbi:MULTISPECIES: NtaA/DmoA family FMN-dependent monooxygenase [Nocardia]|uniref:NtaA/DmoA family FMN-dependent monooxygenase n=1 Tax=Nocardia implantans TaxID=3108168 RepID=A0ABU6AS00_9NOCA|nr:MULTISPECIES: NtaA/DmoA family FMN-dependent monooxygenase [unclassified Nocardia]MBF6191697.1 NtaA/DmoA family FMN-dependent monooxygenase [Nocardia beijingensis]MEA3527994.1 NtaA/DmoA family FMN-dependent monooxygenase [Nocardia sp. CDC192]MEB3510254.1 NtaA/DmoA family FMN-dependent monooxygenase [Nocardia sp. CDC186]
MADQPRHVILNANLIPGGTLGSPWRRAEQPAAHFVGIEHYLDVARIAERGRLDAVFLADSPDLQAKDWNAPSRLLDPFIAQSVLAAHTSHIGLIITATTSYNDPYNLARSFAALSAVSGGRVGWNYVVTGGDAAARNYSLGRALPKSERYARAAEFLDVVTALWDSVPAGALVGDKATGRYLDPAAVRPIDHDGKFFQVAGPLKAPPLTHGRPVLIQAGASTHGVELGARTADAVYSAHVDPGSAAQRRSELRRRAVDAGRAPDSVKLLPGLIVVLADSESAARRRERELIDLIPDEVQLVNLADRLGVEPADLDLDAPLPWERIPDENTDAGSRGQRAVLLEYVRSSGADTRGAARLLASGSVHAKVVGGPEQVAGFIADWFEAGAVDGFNVMIDELPGGLADFVDHVVPLLRGRGLFRTEYDTTTLRGHYRL